MLLLMALYVLLVLALTLAGLAILRSTWSEAPFIPTGRKALQEIFDVIKLRPGEIFYDLGSGDGRVVREAARRGARAVGFEQSRLLTLWARLWAEARPPAARRPGLRIFRPQFIRGNFLTRDLSRADIVFCYLMPKAMEKLKQKFERELRPGTRVVSRAFKIPGWTPIKRLQFGKRGVPVYVYVHNNMTAGQH